MTGSSPIVSPKPQQWSDDLSRWVEENRKYAKEGKCANYIPALAKANPDELGVCLLGSDGTLLQAGQWEKKFTLQSVSKVMFDKDIAKIAKALMLTCGMYNASGKFAAFIGVPAKSGVSGGILATVPSREKANDVPFKQGCGIGIYGPAIDDVGNSMAGQMLLQEIAREWEFNIF